jgi:enterochelin esterase-like enzyme
VAAELAEVSIDGRRVVVWTPPGPPRGRPLLLCHDGQNLFTPEHSISGFSWRLDEAIEALHATTGAVMPVVIAPWNAGGARWAEYAPQEALASGHLVGLPAGGNATRLAGDAYARWCADTVLPWARAELGTDPAADRTAVMGSSMGGLASLYALSRRPGTFGVALCLSTHWSMGSADFVRACIDLLPEPGRNRLWFDHGTEGLDATYGPLQAEADARLVERGWSRDRDFATHVYEGADHHERDWAARVHDPLAFWLSGRG